VVAVAGCLAAAAAWGEDPKQTRLQVSGNGSFGVRMTQPGADQCHLEVLKDNEPLWSLDKCVGTVDDLFFVSNDGQRVWVLKATPEKPGPPKGKKKGTPWYQVEVATLYDAQGNPVQSRRLMDLVQPAERDKVRQLGKHFVWFEGMETLPGRKPRINDAGQVELEVAGSRTVKLNF
jgi:hypothetical protein